jgi:hypothetical protein
LSFSKYLRDKTAKIREVAWRHKQIIFLAILSIIVTAPNLGFSYSTLEVHSIYVASQDPISLVKLLTTDVHEPGYFLMLK